MISIEINGSKYIGFEDAKINLDMEACCSHFEFRATSDGIVNLPIRVDDSVKIYIDKIKVLTGYVDRIEPTYTEDSHDIKIIGRSRTEDIVDSTAHIDVNPPISLKSIFRKTLDSLNLQDMKIIVHSEYKSFQDSEINGQNDTEKTDLCPVASKLAENAFIFLEKYCRKRQVFCTCDGDGNIVLDRASDIKIPLVLFNKKNGQNNILEGLPVYDNSKRYYKYIVRLTQPNTSENADSSIGESDDDSVGIAYDKAIRKSRVLEIKEDKIAGDIQTAQQRAEWEANIRRARSFIYKVKTSEHYINAEHSDIWSTNKQIDVVDEFAGLNTTLLITRVCFRYSNNSGNTTELDLMTKEAMTLKASEEDKSVDLKKEGTGIRQSIDKRRGIR